MRSLMFLALLVVWPGLAAAAPLAGPQGRYCGKLFSAGEVVAAETTFDSTGGRITGQYEFRDGNTVTDGWLVETGSVSARKRLFLWHDRYGQGQLLVTFSSDFDSFDGYWGDDAPKPGNTWTGGRCHEPTS